MKVGIVLPTRGLLLSGEPLEARRLIGLATTAEAAGIDSIWVGDSLTAKPRLEPLSVLAAIAAVTQRVGLGTSVLLGALRQPALLAQASATVDQLSHGRLTLGLGVGGTFTPAQQMEWSVAGVAPNQRARRLGEVVEVIQGLWTGEPISFHGRHFDLDDVSIGLTPYERTRIPVLLACHYGDKRDAQYDRAAGLADGLMSITDSPAEFGSVRSAVLDRVATAGRDPRAFWSTFYMTVHLDEDRAAAWSEGDEFVKRYYGINFWQERWGPYGPPEAVLERALEYARAGADEVIFRFAAFDQETQLDRFIEHVLPSLKALQPSAGGTMA